MYNLIDRFHVFLALGFTHTDSYCMAVFGHKYIEPIPPFMMHTCPSPY